MSDHEEDGRRLPAQKKRRLEDDRVADGHTDDATADGAASQADLRRKQAAAKRAAAVQGSDTEEEGPPVSSSQAIAPRAIAHATGRAGLIQMVKMKNLRCHSNLVVQLGATTNFIIGLNGSGKSTVATAVQLALARNMRIVSDWSAASLISNGHTNAEVEVTFCNVGAEAFNTPVGSPPAQLGPSLTIKRVIAMRGSENMTSGVSLLNHRGQTVATSGEATRIVNAIRDKWNLDAENPVMIMDQQTSKTFLTGNPAEQFDFFVRATGIKKDASLIGEMTVQLADMKEKLHLHDGTMEQLRSAHDKAAKDFAEVRSLKDLANKVYQAKLDEQWAVVCDAQKGIAAQDEVAKAAKLKVEQGKAREEKGIAAVAQKQSVTAEANEALTAKLSQMEGLRDEAAALKTKLHTEMLPLAKAEQDIKDIKAETLAAQKKLEAAKSKLAAHDADVARRTNQTKTAARRAAIEKATAELEAGKTNLHAAEDEDLKARKLVEEANAEAAAANQRMNDAAQEHEQAKMSLRDFLQRQAANKSGQTRPIDLFHVASSKKSQVAALIHAEIEKNAHLFKYKPQGPLGSLVTVADPQWREAATLLFKNPNTFILQDYDDAKTLEKLVVGMGRDNKLPLLDYQVVKPVTARYAVPAPPSELREAGHLFLSDILHATTDVAFNAMMDDLKPSRVLLGDGDQNSVRENMVKMGHLARDLLGLTRSGHLVSVSSTGQSTRNLKAEQLRGIMNKQVDTLLMVDDTKAPARSSGGAGAGAGAAPSQPVDVKAMLEQRVKDTGAAVEDAKRAYKMTQMKLDAATQEQFSSRKKLQLAGKEIARANMALQAAKAMPEDDPLPESEVDEIKRAGLESALLEAQDEVKERKAELAAVQAELDKLKPSVDRLRSELEAMTKRLTGDQELRELREAVTRAKTDEDNTAQQLERLRAKIKEVEDEALTEMDKLAKMQDTVTQQIAGLRVATGLSNIPEGAKDGVKAAAARTKNLAQQLAKAEQSTGGMGEYERRRTLFEAAKLKLEETESEMGKLKKLHGVLVQTQQHRWSTMTKLREEAQANVAKIFKAKMSERGHFAELKFDVDDEKALTGTMRVVVSPDARQRGTAGMKMKQVGMEAGQLSGGEKSQTAVILLTAIARVAAPRFRIIDEYDVFQDETTRNFVTSYLMNEAREAAGGAAESRTQYILLTPHDVTAQVKDDANVCIRKMDAPRKRGEEAAAH